MNDQVLVSRADGVCEVQLNRPEKRNALTLAMYGAITDALNEARADESIRVVLISGAGASFTAGNDLNDFISHPAGPVGQPGGPMGQPGGPMGQPGGPMGQPGGPMGQPVPA